MEIGMVLKMSMNLCNGFGTFYGPGFGLGLIIKKIIYYEINVFFLFKNGLWQKSRSEVNNF